VSRIHLIFSENLSLPSLKMALSSKRVSCFLSREEEINQWYVEEHIPRLMNLQSVLSVRRFVCIEGSSKYLSLYEAEEVESLKDDDCKQALKERASQLREYTKNVRRKVYKKYREGSFDHIKFFI